MDLGPLRALVLDLNTSAHGVDVVVTRPFPEDIPIPTRGIWQTTVTEDVPTGMEFQRREPRRVMAISRVAVPVLPRGTLIVAPEKSGDVDQRWRVTDLERQEADQNRVVLEPYPDPEP